MLKIIRSLKDLNFRQLADVYIQSCQERGSVHYSGQTAQQQLLSEQDLYGEVKCFLADKNAFYAVWESDGKYVSALRIEPYKDGLLLEGLETLPEQRCKGYAKQLVSAVLSELSEQGSAAVYSHIDKKNTASLAVHLDCGFEIVRECAVYADGSVSQNAYTMCK